MSNRRRSVTGWIIVTLLTFVVAATPAQAFADTPPPMTPVPWNPVKPINPWCEDKPQCG